MLLQTVNPRNPIPICLIEQKASIAAMHWKDTLKHVSCVLLVL